ncbi:MAG: ribonuclease H-like domain-containing protein [Pseudomonadota bacterium]
MDNIKFASFDLEIAKEIPENSDWHNVAPLGITCAAVALSDQEEPIFWQGVPQMTRSQCQEMVKKFQELVRDGYTFLTWNGCSFDFAVLAQESGMTAECAELAMNHIDLMLIVTFTKGWFLSLQKALEGAGLKGKLKTVTLSSGEELNSMTGAKAPQLWAAGEHDAVLTYLREDVMRLLKLVDVVLQNKSIVWTSNNGNPQRVDISKLLTVKECFDIPEPDVSWMTEPPTREQFVKWMES